jgi:hypothetical protein
MGTHARIENGYISIDTTAWLEQRTAGQVTELTDDLRSWGARTLTWDRSLRGWVDLVPLWRLARGYVSPDPADPGDPAILAHAGTRLDAEVWIARMLTPSHGRVAVVRRDDDPPVVFTDTSETADWYDADTVQISCPNGHGWWWRTGRELLTAEGSFTTLTMVWGANLDAPFSRCRVCNAYDTGRRSAPCGCDGTPWIICPTCDQRCDVELPAR